MDEKVHLSLRTIIKYSHRCLVLDGVGHRDNHYSGHLHSQDIQKTRNRQFARSDDREINPKFHFTSPYMLHTGRTIYWGGFSYMHVFGGGHICKPGF